VVFSRQLFLKLGLVLVAVTVLAGCQLGGFGQRGPNTLAQSIRGVDGDQSQGLQIYGLRNPVVSELMDKALQAEAAGRYDLAMNHLKKAQAIEPQAPDILQQMAEVSIEQGRWDQAKAYARQSIDLGPRVGHLCKRNWRALAMVHSKTGDQQASGKAAARVELCVRDRPARF